MNRFYKVFVNLIVIIVLFEITGCKLWDEVVADLNNDNDPIKKKLKYIVSVHDIVKYPRGTKLEQEVPTMGNQTVWINKNPYLHSRNIKEIEPVPCEGKEGFYDLKIKLDRKGRKMWMMLSVQYRHESLAFVIDGVFYRSIRPTRITNEDTEWVFIKGQFFKHTANSLKENAPLIYDHYYVDCHINL